MSRKIYKHQVSNNYRGLSDKIKKQVKPNNKSRNSTLKK